MLEKLQITDSPEEAVDERGKVRKHNRYSDMMSPYEKRCVSRRGKRQCGRTLEFFVMLLRVIVFSVEDESPGRKASQ